MKVNLTLGLNVENYETAHGQINIHAASQNFIRNPIENFSTYKITQQHK